MRSVIVIEIEHKQPIPHLADMVAGRAWSINGVSRAEVVQQRTPQELEAMGFTMAEIALGAQDVAR